MVIKLTKKAVHKFLRLFGYGIHKIMPVPMIEPVAEEPPIIEEPAPVEVQPANLVTIDLDNFFVLPKKDITYSYDLLYTYHNCDFMKDPRFMEAYRLGRATDVHETVLKNYDIYWRIHVLCWAATYAAKLEGDFVDCGVNTGIFSRAIIHYIDFNSTSKTYYLLDTFTGLDERFSTPEEMEQPLNQKYTTYKDGLYERVQETFKGFNVNIIKGAVPETLPLVTAEKVAYLSVDMNCIQPEIDTLNHFWDKLTPGGIIVLDDYGYGNITNEQKAAHDEFARSKGVEVLSVPTCQGIIIKPLN
ncbi:TylF/MycF/NovP-related O-methyltransferase [Mucilaginibacter sp. CSA2-8R]|uniref:TylF/MycF/NovP-related O-methyltransferase n=1 Tax=Mucilaginibacter sp. CSA2-8R TaxID=3141542 RepID=UPI00315CBF10